MIPEVGSAAGSLGRSDAKSGSSAKSASSAEHANALGQFGNLRLGRIDCMPTVGFAFPLRDIDHEKDPAQESEQSRPSHCRSSRDGRATRVIARSGPPPAKGS
jgi:hypothetical protein